jgi:hypothetical protein
MASGPTRRKPEGSYEGREEDPDGGDSESVTNIEKGKKVRFWISKCSPNLGDLYLGIQGIVSYNVSVFFCQ